ncbi:hypothetical protein ACSBR1_028860 [Camellia fascicularis]
MTPVNIATVILAKAGEYLVAPIGNQLRYFHGYNINIENFQKQLEKLCDSRTRIQQSVNAATRNGEQIKAGVQKWLRNADLVIAEAEEFDFEVQLNRRCFNGWCPDWMSRYKLSKEAINKTATIAELHGNGQIEHVSLPAPPPGIAFISGKDFVTVESIESTMDQIVEALQDSECDIVGVYGMGGIGKTTLVKEVGKRVKDLGLFDEVVLAVVSQTPNLRKIQGQIADMLGMKFSEESEIGRAGRLYGRLKNEERVLIILDDVWASINLVDVGIPRGDDHKGCKILLTTRRESVCSVMGIRMKKFQVSHLSIEESWDLFRKSTGTIVDSSTLNGVAMEVSRECGGLPLALVTVGRALRDKGLEEWKTALQQLKKSKPLMDYLELDHVFSCLKLSYDYLRSEEIKLCFLFCCLFPEDHDIKIEDLTRYGMGKRLFRDAETIEEARKQAHSIIRYLKASCLLLDSDKEGCVKIHDMVRDFAISVASKGNHGFLVRAGVGLKEWPKRETFEHNTIISLTDNNILELPEGLECPKLQMLLLGENEGFEVIPNEVFEGMVGLKVLDLSERIGVHSLLPVFPGASSHRPRILTLPSSLNLLANLRTLHLDRCRLGNLSLLGKLKKLEILSFFGSDIKELPMEIRELSNLRLLDLSFCQKLKTIPANLLSHLFRLEELYMGGSFRKWEDEGSSKACLAELQSLSHLSILCVELKHMGCFPENLLLPSLAKFEITIGYDSMNCYPNSRNLYLRDTALVEGIKALFGTTENLTLNCATKGLTNFLPGIDQKGLNGLKTLNIMSADEMIHLIDTTKWNPPIVFAELEELHLRILDGMPAICSGFLPSGSFQKLRILKIEWCSALWYIVSDNLLPRLQNLEQVTAYNCGNVQTIFKIEGNACKEENSLLLSTLKVLRLESLFHLMYICKGSIRNVRFTSLTVVEIKHCQNIAHLFSTSMAQSMLQLEILKIESCIRMEAIVPNVETGLEFPNLKELQVKRCLAMRTLFSVAVGNAQSEGEEKKNIIFAQLDRFQLINMPVLERFCSMDYGVELPSLKELEVEKCPMMKNFSDFGFKGMPSAVKIQVDEDSAFQKFCLDDLDCSEGNSSTRMVVEVQFSSNS